MADVIPAAGGATPVVTLTVLLNGGYKYLLQVAPDNPVIGTLFGLMAQPQQQGRRRLFQLPLNNGTSLLTFSGEQLVGVSTEPPLVIQPDGKLALSANVTLPGSRALAPEVEASRVLVLDNFLLPNIHSRLLAYALSNEARFVPTTTATQEANYRESLVLHDFPEFAEIMRKAIRKIIPDVRQQLGCKPLSETIEAQLTAHNDGNYYRVHNDNGSADSRQRELTYVYYFNSDPKAYSGGELKVYDSKVEKGFYVAADSSQLIEPRNNRIVFFQARYMHEVLPVRCPSKKFADSRFTINGWVHRQEGQKAKA